MTCSRCGDERCRANLTSFGVSELLCPECLGKQAVYGYEPLDIRGYQAQKLAPPKPQPAFVVQDVPRTFREGLLAQDRRVPTSVKRTRKPRTDTHDQQGLIA